MLSGGFSPVGFVMWWDGGITTMAYTGSDLLEESNATLFHGAAEALSEDLRRMPLYSVSLLSRRSDSSLSLQWNMGEGQCKPRISVSLMACNDVSSVILTNIRVSILAGTNPKGATMVRLDRPCFRG